MEWRISIHALREEGDPKAAQHVTTFRCISIHALREEGDRGHPHTQGADSNFYPRPPRGGRPQTRKKAGQQVIFLSTPSARRATYTLPLPS